MKYGTITAELTINYIGIRMTKNFPLGVSKHGKKTLFSVYSEHAHKIELCLFSDDEKSETRIPLTKDENNVWSADLDNIKPGQKYGYRAYGEFAPQKGLYFNPNKLLIDPFAKDLSSTLKDWEDPALALTNNIDSAYAVPKSVVVFDDPKADAQKYPYLHKKPQTEWKDTVIYEANVKGFSAIHPDLPEDERGTFKAFANPEVIQYLKSLGITHLELMPVTTTCGGLQLKKEKGLSDYWGYNPINHFALDKRYGTREDFKQMVNELHKAGIEVGLDVVYNHTGEFGAEHNLLSYKGLDAPNYYRLTPDGYFIDTTGCKNSMNTNTPIMRRLLEDSLNYFAKDMGVDGFRFDLAGDCALDGNTRFDENGQFLSVIRKISEEQGVKISGEPWSAMGGYYRGNMKGMMEWNDKHEAAVRSFYRGDEYIVPELAGHISGGEGLWYGQNTSKYIRYVAAHDGFTAYDVVNYNEKNNWANNEYNNDGNNNNHSSVSPSREIAFRRIKSMMAANILSRGVPMICAGDELARTQQGNNNAYCQDNELTWLNWKHFSPEQRDLYLHIRKLTALRSNHPTFANLDVFSGEIVPSNGRKDIEWIRPDGQEMQNGDWNNQFNHILACVINGKNGEVSKNPASRKNSDDDFMILMCGNTYGIVDFKLPTPPNKQKWELVFDTTGKHKKINDNGTYSLEPYSYVLLTSRKQERTNERTIDFTAEALKAKGRTSY
ncbi:MAG: alpha-amylase family glycosyl hydrolase [Alphaproteobacteria bacterium]